MEVMTGHGSFNKQTDHYRPLMLGTLRTHSLPAAATGVLSLGRAVGTDH